MERAGLFCWKWFFSSLLWPRAVGPSTARLAEFNRGCWVVVNWIHWQWERPARHWTDVAVGAARVAFTLLTSVTNRPQDLCYTFRQTACPLPWQPGPPPWKMLACVCGVFTINSFLIFEDGSGSGFLLSCVAKTCKYSVFQFRSLNSSTACFVL